MSKENPNFIVKLLVVLGRALSRPFVWLWKKAYAFFSGLHYGEIARKVGKAIYNFFHWLIFKVLMPKKYRNITKKELYSIIFNSDTPAGKRFDVWLLVLIGFNLLIIMLDSFNAVHNNLRWVLTTLEWILTIIFTLEYYLRIYCSPSKRKYIFSFYGIIDFFSIFPAYLSILIPATQTLTVLRVLRALRIFRIFNMQKFVHESMKMMNILRRSAKKILIFSLFMLVAAIILGSVLFMFESNVNPALTSIPRAIYWAVMTISTVGYGDITPVTTIGQVLSTFVMLLGYSIIAVPTGIMAGETIREYRRGGNAEPDGSEPNDDADDNDSAQADATRFCPHCGHTESDPRARYCRYCGTRLTKNSKGDWINNFFD